MAGLQLAWKYRDFATVAKKSWVICQIIGVVQVAESGGIDVTKQLIDRLIGIEGGCHQCTYLSKVLSGK